MAKGFILSALVTCAVLVIEVSAVQYSWNSWTSWSSCNATCEGIKYRIRTCLRYTVNKTVSHPTEYYARYCTEHHLSLPTDGSISSTRSHEQYDRRACSASCPVARKQRASSYQWGDWTSWTLCNATCSGTQYQLRSCRHRISDNSTTYTSVTISYCDRSKTGNYDHKRRDCGSACVVNIWSNWSAWSACSSSCDDGTSYRGRHCESGDNCVGAVFDQQVCNLGRCLHPVDGDWGEWQQWGPCSTSCSLGYNVRYRACDSPAPKDGGSQCSGKRDQVRVCPLVNCPIDGGWGNYTTTQCTVTCGVGLIVSSRKCDQPLPQYGGKMCEGGSTLFDKCTNPDCDVDGNWSKWGNFTECKVVCGTGHVRRSRTCTDPAPHANGSDCVGDAVEMKECDNGQCPPDIKICDKAQISKLAPQTVNTVCPADQQPSVTGYSFVESYCTVPSDKSKWRLGIKIQNNCEMIPLFSPVGTSDNGVHVKEVGILSDCADDTLKILTQNCNSDVVLKSYNVTDVFTSFHMILFNN